MDDKQIVERQGRVDLLQKRGMVPLTEAPSELCRDVGRRRRYRWSLVHDLHVGRLCSWTDIMDKSCARWATVGRSGCGKCGYRRVCTTGPHLIWTYRLDSRHRQCSSPSVEFNECIHCINLYLNILDKKISLDDDDKIEGHRLMSCRSTLACPKNVFSALSPKKGKHY